MSYQNDFLWQGRVDAEDGPNGKRWHQVINASKEYCDAALLGFACDIGVANNKGRIGAAAGPDTIRQALTNMAWHHRAHIKDAGTVVADYDLVAAQQAFAERVSKHLSCNEFVIGIGGGHEIGWASYLGVHQARPDKRIGIINIDAHFDLRQPSPNTSSGTPFWQVAQHCQQQNQGFHYACLGIAPTANTVALYNRAAELDVVHVRDLDCNMTNVVPRLTDFLAQIDVLYLTICLDAFPASMAPGVSAPSVIGVELKFVLQLLVWLAKQQHYFGYDWAIADIAEMNPTYDIDNRTAKLAARLIDEIMTAKFNHF
ncbi:formimidoylglutamase [Alteromonas sp. ASW11-36]|uniref:Formimidoylglutamase n=1 Tax=Alteromonas arenosi TaxID=3055817 RepID=A0ABT7ST94_9ALTE|nr:formimidoylglutamase [Alteromonas sp. ASW11-36]MDM7859395.1 formimidoylglutamase [Alteromonas sp. ASW11-36]